MNNPQSPRTASLLAPFGDFSILSQSLTVISLQKIQALFDREAGYVLHVLFVIFFY
jgi:hypothetical protein